MVRSLSDYSTPRPGPGRVGTAMGFRPTPTPTRTSGTPLLSAGGAAPKPTGDSRNIQAPAAPAVPVPAVSQERGPLEWRDSGYNSQIAAIQRALQDFETQAQTRGERYGQDFMTGLGRLGYRPGTEFQAMPNILEAVSVQPMARMAAVEGGEMAAPTVAVTPITGAFDIEGQFDPYSAAARGTRGLRDEFAGRGTLRSSDFAKTFGEFQNRLNQQLEAMEVARGRFGQDLATEVAQQRVQAQERRDAAQRDAMMRAAMAAASGAGF